VTIIVTGRKLGPENELPNYGDHLSDSLYLVKAVDTDHRLSFDKDPFSTNVQGVVVVDTGEPSRDICRSCCCQFSDHISPGAVRCVVERLFWSCRV
jgi:hypothetical protein